MTQLHGKKLAWAWLGSLLVMAGYWAPWATHKSPSLVLIGFDLAEFVKFTTDYRIGALAGIREALWLPPAAAALLLALAVVRSGEQKSLPAWGAASATGFLMALTLLPPFPYRAAVLFSPEFRGQTVLALIGMVACLVALLVRQYGFTAQGSAWRWLAAMVAVAGFALPVWECVQIKPLLDSLYGRPVTPGWGIPLMAVGFALAAWGVWQIADS